MAISFDNLVFSSSLIIFILTLVSIFAYQFVWTREQRQELGKIADAGKASKKSTKQVNKKQFDKIE
jgi:hypothetical protein